MTIIYNKQVLLKRGNTAESSTYVGPLGEAVIDTDLMTIRVQDGITAGGHILGNANVQSYLSSFKGNIIPAANVTYTLGNSTNQWKELWVSGNTIYIGNVPLSLDTGTNELRVNNVPISQTITYTDIPDVPTDISDLTDNEGLLNGGGGSGDRLSNGVENELILESDGDLTLPAGGVIAEGVVTNNPTIELTPAGPDVASQKLIIKGGNSFYTEANGIGLGINNNVWSIGDTISVVVYTDLAEGTTLYWWIYPEVGQGEISDPGFGTVTLDAFGNAEITFELDSDDYAFTVRVSTVVNVYNESTGVESVTLNSESGPADTHHLHLTTGDLQETSIFLGTDEHNVRTRINGDIEITARDYDNEVSRNWQFNKDGELVLPADVSGANWAAINHALDWDEGDTEYRAVAVGPDGAIYAGGRRDGYPTVTKMEADGDIVYSKIVSVSGEGFINGRVNSIEYATAEGTPVLVVMLEVYPNYIESVIVGLDPTTGELVGGDFAAFFAQDNEDLYITEAAPVGEETFIFAGSKSGSFVDYPVTAQTGSTTGTIIINRTDLPPGIVLDSNDSDYVISGTGFATSEELSGVNRYTGLTGTVREGSGAVFTVQDNGNGTYGGAVTTAGSNYLPGHKILILGTSLGGTTPTNDAVVEVTIVNESGGVTGISITGTAAGTEVLEYTGLSGTNYNVGSGLQFDLSYFSTGYADGDIDNYNGGTNYVEGDVITILGTSLGGATPTNDMTITVNTIDGGGAITGSGIAGVAQTATWKVETTTQVDFTAEGDWNISVSYERENFLTTFTGNNSVFFGLGEVDEDDRLYAVATEGLDVYAIGESYVSTEEDSYDAAVIYKFSIDPETAAFTLEWARVLNEGSYDHEGKSVAVGSDGVYATMVGYGEGTYTGLVKLDKTTGDILWKKGTNSGDDSSVAVDPDTGLIWVAAEGGVYDVVADDAIKLIAFDSTGAVQDRRWLARIDDDLYFKNGRCLRISDDHIVVVGYSESETGSNLPFIFRVPKAEQQEGFAQGDFLLHNAGDYDIFDLEGDFSYTVSPQIYPDSTVFAGPATIADEDFEDSRTFESLSGSTSAIVFSDGSRMETAPEKGIPQNNRSYDDYTLTLADNGKHIFHPGSGYRIYVPANEELALPIGYTVTLITKNDGTLYIEASSYYGDTEYYAEIVGVGLDQQGRYWTMPQRSIATLIKVEENLWYLSGPGIEAS